MIARGGKVRRWLFFTAMSAMLVACLSAHAQSKLDVHLLCRKWLLTKIENPTQPHSEIVPEHFVLILQPNQIVRQGLDDQALIEGFWQLDTLTHRLHITDRITGNNYSLRIDSLHADGLILHLRDGERELILHYVPN